MNSLAARLRAAGASVTVVARHQPDDADDFVAADITTRDATDAVADHVSRRSALPDRRRSPR